MDPFQQNILVIKLGALGDLLRTTPILPSLRLRYPRARITWLTRPDCVPLLRNLEEIDRLWVTDASATARVLAERFDLLINFDKDTPAAELATLANADEKRGFGLTSRGALTAWNAASLYALQLGIDDELKFRRNRLTYPQIIHQMAELPIEGTGPEYQIRLSPEEAQFGSAWISSWLASEFGGPQEKSRPVPLLGVNPGAGKVFATKKWRSEGYIEVAERLHRDHAILPVLFGGADETELNEKIHKALRKNRVPVLRPGENLDLRQFISLVSRCDGFLSGDTLGMHIALGSRVPTVALFTSTCAQEIELYGRGTAIVGKAPCAPCYLSRCPKTSQHCAESISAEEVYQAVVERMGLASSDELRRHSHV